MRRHRSRNPDAGTALRPRRRNTPALSPASPVRIPATPPGRGPLGPCRDMRALPERGWFQRARDGAVIGQARRGGVWHASHASTALIRPPSRDRACPVGERGRWRLTGPHLCLAPLVRRSGHPVVAATPRPGRPFAPPSGGHWNQFDARPRDAELCLSWDAARQQRLDLRPTTPDSLGWVVCGGGARPRPCRWPS